MWIPLNPTFVRFSICFEQNGFAKSRKRSDCSLMRHFWNVGLNRPHVYVNARSTLVLFLFLFGKKLLPFLVKEYIITIICTFICAELYTCMTKLK